MYIIVGLGNPGEKYDNTRHNCGFMTIDCLADKYNLEFQESKQKAMVAKGSINGEKVILAKPLTFMNLSGESVRALADYYKVDSEKEVIIVYDDISLPVGNLRIRVKGSAGGHNGIKSIISHLGSDKFIRVKVGVGEKPKGYDLADYVLGHFSNEEKVLMNEAFSRGAKAIEAIMEAGPDKAMNLFNS